MKYLIVSLFAINLAFPSEKIKVEVPGMVCQMCVQGMRKNFKSAVENPDKDVIVDLDKKTVTVTLKKEISEDEIKQRVKDAGYNAKKISWFDKVKKKFKERKQRRQEKRAKKKAEKNL